MISQSNEQTLEASIEKALSGIIRETLKEQTMYSTPTDLDIFFASSG